jgi:hypothetical protein
LTHGVLEQQHGKSKRREKNQKIVFSFVLIFSFVPLTRFVSTDLTIRMRCSPIIDIHVSTGLGRKKPMDLCVCESEAHEDGVCDGVNTTLLSDTLWSIGLAESARGKRFGLSLFYYETIIRKLNRRLVYEFRWDERLKPKTEGSTLLVYTGLFGGLEHLKIETRCIDESFASVMGECVILTPQVHRRYST